MADRQITCMTTSGRREDCTCITHIGRFPDLGGRITRVEGVRRLQQGIDRFYAVDPLDRRRVWVKVVKRGTVQYLRTAANDTPHDNLLALPEC